MRSPVTSLFAVLLLGGASPLVAQAMIQVSPNPKPTRTPTECVGVTVPPDASSSTPDFHPAGLLIVLPPRDPSHALLGKTVDVRLLIGTRGKLDSVQVSGIADEQFRKRYVRQIWDDVLGRKLFPAIYQGCAVGTWVSYTVRVEKD